MNKGRKASFVWERRLKKVVKDLGPAVAGVIAAGLVQFQRQYEAVKTDLELPPRFNFKVLKNTRMKDSHGTYALYQIHIAPNGQYRAVMLRSSSLPHIYWVWVFKKQRMNEPGEIVHARTRAADVWEAIDWQEIEG